MTDLGTLGGEGKDSWASGINDSGQVVGLSVSTAGTQSAMLWTSSDGMIDLKALLGTSSSFSYLTAAITINDKGQIVGQGVTTNGNTHAFLMTPVPIPGAVWLLGSGLAGLAGLRRFRKNG